MIGSPNSNKMLEATRLTRAGKLGEATALIQRMLRGEPERDTPPGAVVPAQRGPQHPTIELSASAGEMDHAAARVSIPAWKPAFAAKLRQTQDALAAKLGLRGLARPVPVPTPDIVPKGGRFIEATYSNHAGTRAYKLYIPSGYHGQAIPLIVMLHGCTQSPDDFAAGTRMNFIAEEQACFVAYPAQCGKANVARCWNWFRPSDQQRDEGEPSLIAGITRQIMRDYSVDPQRVYIGGLSAGAAAAAVMGATYADVYAAIGVHSGLACGVASDVPSAFAAMRQGMPSAASDAVPEIHGRAPSVPTIVFHGDADKIVHPGNGDHVIALGRTATLQTNVHRGRVPGGHAYTRTVHTDENGRTILEQWNIHGAGHAWSGGSPTGSYTDPRGPDAAREMMRFFLAHRRTPAISMAEQAPG